MIRMLLAILIWLGTTPAKAGQIDYFCLFANAAAAQADASVGAFWNGSTWDLSTTFPSISVATPAALINGISPVTGFWIVVSRPTSSNSGLDGDAACQIMKLDRDLAAVGGNFVISASISGTNRTNLTFQPVPHGSNYPRPLGK